MAYRWENGRLVQYDPNDPRARLNSLVQQRENLERELSQYGEEDKSIFDTVTGAVGGALNYIKPTFHGAIDVLSRPNYMMAEATRAAFAPGKRGGVAGSALDALVGAGRGFTGTKKTSFTDVLADQGVGGNVGFGLGLAGDIFLDPTTYVGALPLKAIGKSERVSKGLQTLGDVSRKIENVVPLNKADYIRDPKMRRSIELAAQRHGYEQAAREVAEKAQKGTNLHPRQIRELRNTRSREFLEERLGAIAAKSEEQALRRTNDILKTYGVAKQSKSPLAIGRERALKERAEMLIRHEKPTMSLNKLTEKYAREELYDLSKAAQKIAEENIDLKRAGVQLRFGKHTTEIRADNPIVSKLVDNPVGVKATSKIVNSPVTQTLNRLFRTEGTYGRQLNELRKTRMHEGVTGFDDIVSRIPIKLSTGESKTLDKIYEGFNAAEAEEFTNLLEAEDYASIATKTTEAGTPYSDLLEARKKVMDDIYLSEVELGIQPRMRDKNGNLVTDENGAFVPAREKIDNYVYHMPTKGYRKWEGFKRRHYAKAVGSDVHSPAMERAIKTIDDAPPGVTFEKNIEIIDRNRIAKHTQAVARRNFIVDAAHNFGVTVNNKAALRMLNKEGHDLVNLKKVLEDVDKGAHLEYLPDNMYIPSEFADKLRGIQQMAYTPGPIMEKLDSIIRLWKPAATVYNPGHHIRNLIGDVSLSYIDGVTDIRWYERANDMLDKPWLKSDPERLAGHLKMGDGMLRKRQIMASFHRSGAAPGFIQTDVIDPKQFAAAGKVSKTVHGVAKSREEFARLSHYLYALDDEISKAGIKHGGEFTPAVEEAAKRAAMRVKKWHIDYADLTEFEKTVMKRVIPFYTWMRKSVPLIVEAMALRPGKVVNMDKTFDAFMQMMGMPPEMGGTPVDTIPDWIREAAYGQLGLTSRGNPLMMSPDFPQQEMFEYTQEGPSGALNKLLSSINPVLKMGVEFGTGRSTFTGAPLGGRGQYAADIIPSSRVLRQTIETINGQDPDVDQGFTPLLNWATGLGLREVTPRNQRGELQRQLDPLQNQIREARARNPQLAERLAQEKRRSRGKRFVWQNGRLVSQ